MLFIPWCYESCAPCLTSLPPRFVTPEGRQAGAGFQRTGLVAFRLRRRARPKRGGRSMSRRTGASAVDARSSCGGNLSKGIRAGARCGLSLPLDFARPPRDGTAFKARGQSRQLGDDKFDCLFRRHGYSPLEGEKLLCHVSRLFLIEFRFHEPNLPNATREPICRRQACR